MADSRVDRGHLDVVAHPSTVGRRRVRHKRTRSREHPGSTIRGGRVHELSRELVGPTALAALSVAGLVMAWLVLDAPGDLLSTDWGQSLLVKVAAVAVVAGLGGDNHFGLRPALEAHPDDPAVAARLRTSLSIESLVMVAVIVITAVLVASST